MKKKVVIIDDEPWTRDVIVKLTRWQELGLELVGEAADGETGMELVREIRPDIVITDVRMPRISGIELVRIMRGEGLSTPVLIISGYDEFEYVRSALKLGVADYLLKPIKAEELNQQLKSCVQLLKKEELIPNSSMQLGFFADGWQSGYSRIKASIETALQLGNKEKVRSNLAELSRLIAENEGSNPSMTTMIGIYYALLFPLQKYVDTMGMEREDVFGKAGPQFVFSRDNTIAQMTEFINGLYNTVIDRAERQQHSRLDIEAVCRYISENYTAGITLEHTADVFHVTKEYLSKAFKTARGEGFSEYVTSMRMKKAYELISEYDAPLKDVGAMVGYYDLAHFYKTFKKHFGKTPGEIKSRLKNNKETDL